MALGPIDFRRAAYGDTPVSIEACLWCGRRIDGEFFRANGEMICGNCALAARCVMPQNDRGTFWRATGAGTLVAIATSLMYLQLARWTAHDLLGAGIVVGALGVGFAVGRAMRVAANGAGGRRYQWAAAVLTYCAIMVGFVAATIPMESVPLWAYPMLTLAPLVNLILGHYQQGLLQLFFAYMGIQWAWGQLQAHPLKLTGPETLGGAKTEGSSHPRG